MLFAAWSGQMHGFNSPIKCQIINPPIVTAYVEINYVCSILFSTSMENVYLFMIFHL